MTEQEEKERNERLEEIAKGCLGVVTLKTRNSDGLDFYDVPIWDIKQALELAWASGRNSK